MQGKNKEKSKGMPRESGEGFCHETQVSEVGMAWVQDPEGLCFLYQPLGGIEQGYPQGWAWLDTPVPTLLAIALKVSLEPLVHLGFQVKFWLKLACC